MLSVLRRKGRWVIRVAVGDQVKGGRTQRGRAEENDLHCVDSMGKRNLESR